MVCKGLDWIMAGRPKRQFTEEEIAKIDEMSLRNSQTGTIAQALDIPYKTLDRHFGKRMSKNRAIWKDKLREAQAKLMETNPAMAIFLGKNELEQTDKQTIANEQTETQAPTGAAAELAKEIAKQTRIKLARGA